MLDRIYEKIDNIQSVNNSEVSPHETIASKFLETMDLFKSLLIANQELRDEMTQQGILLDQSAAEKRALIVRPSNQGRKPRSERTASSLDPI
jgi:hypothetical protein